MLLSFEKLLNLKEEMESEKDPIKQHLLNEQFEHLGGNLIESRVGKVCYFLNISEELKKQNILNKRRRKEPYSPCTYTFERTRYNSS